MQEKLDKIVQLAKRGEGGEKETARRMVKAICEREGLDFDDVMSDAPKTQEFSLRYVDRREEELLEHVIAKFAMLTRETRMFTRYGRSKEIFFETTTEKYIDTVNAWHILRKQMRAEIAKIPLAMIYKHDLFYQPTTEEWEKIKKERPEATKEELEKAMKARAMAYGLDDVELQRRLKA